LIKQFSKYQIATAIAILFHVIGLVGILVLKNDFILKSTPINLVLMFGLVIYTQTEKNKFFYAFLFICIGIGIVVEIIGVNTQALFGNYSYGNILGLKIKNVPILIGINWFIIIYCCGISMQTLLQKAINRIATETTKPPLPLKAISIIIDGATLALLFDFIMEPVAVKLGYWQWLSTGQIPTFNYVCWFVVSAGLLTIFHVCKFNKQNKFAINLLLIQFMFFLILRTFL
jgi:bisanhydrobacterioruberin hydratase